MVGDMVRKKEHQSKILYQCEVCGLWYRNREKAAACEAWCRKHKSCNIEIIAHAVEEGRE